MRHVAAGLGIVCVLAASSSVAGPYSDEMAKCLVRSTSSADKIALIQWMFAMASLNPEVRQMSAVTPAQRNQLNQRLVSMTEKLLTESCLNESREAVKYEGPETVKIAFTVLGQVAARELFAGPEVAAGMQEMATLFDTAKVQSALGLKK